MKAEIIIILLISFIIQSCNKFDRINDISEKIEERLSGKSKKAASVKIQEKKLFTSPALITFYDNRDFDQAWTTKKGLNTNGEELFNK